MFLLLQDDKVIDFWGNRVGDIFIEGTIKNLKLDAGKVKLLHFEELNEKPEFYKINKDSLIIQKKITSQVEEEIILEDGTKSIQTKIVESFEDDKTLEAEVFFDKGIVLKLC